MFELGVCWFGESDIVMGQLRPTKIFLGLSDHFGSSGRVVLVP